MIQILIFIISLFLASVLQAVETVSVSVGRAGTHVVSSREVAQNHYVEQALFQGEGKMAPLPSLKDRKYNRHVNAVLLEWVVYLEAKNFSAAEVNEKDIQKALVKVKGKLSKVKSWKKLETQESELRDLVERKLRAKSFIQFKARSSVIPISDMEAQKYFKENRARFGKLPFKNFEKSIKTYLGRQQMDQRLRDWFEVLRAKHRVKNILLEL